MPVDTNGKRHPYMDHHGAVLNIEGFPGKIDFIKNIVRYNMYFINDVYTPFRASKVSETVFNIFMASNQVQMLKCDTNGQKIRFFGDHLNSFTE